MISDLIEKRAPKPPRILVYGGQGMGKTTFGSLAPKPIFIQTEDGLDAIDSDAFPLARSFQDVFKYLDKLCREEHSYETLVVDSLDWMEPLIWSELIRTRPQNERGAPVKSIEDYGYGKGYLMVLDIWDYYIKAINYLRSERNMTIIQIAHSQIRRFENPETDAYDRYEIKLHKGASAKIQEHADAVFFINDSTTIKKEEKGFGGERKRAVGSGDRYIHTTQKPAFVAKTRYDLPEEILFDKGGEYWKVLKSSIPFFMKGNANG